MKVVYDDDYENGALWIKVRKLKLSLSFFLFLSVIKLIP
nr:MAG TPA: hypothetical protein [Caudoviricetes sp.]